jgi:hypothetical protein
MTREAVSLGMGRGGAERMAVIAFSVFELNLKGSQGDFSLVRVEASSLPFLTTNHSNAIDRT